MAAARELFGADARIETLTGAEGIEYQALVIHGTDPARRMEAIFGEGKDAPIASLTVGEGSKLSVAGLRIGDTAAQMQAANGRPFSFYGFSWDYGGNTTGWNGGTLERLPGGCTVSARLDPRASDLPSDLMGDAEFSSDVGGLAAADARIDELRLIYPD